MEEEIREKFRNADIELIAGSDGIFDITFNETLIFSKKENIGTDTQQFPQAGDIASLLLRNT